MDNPTYKDICHNLDSIEDHIKEINKMISKLEAERLTLEHQYRSLAYLLMSGRYNDGYAELTAR